MMTKKKAKENKGVTPKKPKENDKSFLDFLWVPPLQKNNTLKVDVWKTLNRDKQENIEFETPKRYQIKPIIMSTNKTEKEYYRLGIKLNNLKVNGKTEILYFKILVYNEFGAKVSESNRRLLAADKKSSFNMLSFNGETNNFLNYDEHMSRIKSQIEEKKAKLIEVELIEETIDDQVDQESNESFNENNNKKRTQEFLLSDSQSQISNYGYEQGENLTINKHRKLDIHTSNTSCSFSNTSTSQEHCTSVDTEPFNENQSSTPPLNSMEHEDFFFNSNIMDLKELMEVGRKQEFNNLSSNQTNCDEVENQNFNKYSSFSSSNQLENVNCEENSLSQSYESKDNNQNELFPSSDLSVLGEPEYQSPHSPVATLKDQYASIYL